MRPPFARARRTWTDLSEFVVHLARGDTDRASYDNIMGILWSQSVRASGPVGIGRSVAPHPAGQMSASFTEIPVDQLRRLARRRMRAGPSSWHGIAFRKDRLIEQGGCPILYAYQGSSAEMAMRSLMDRALSSDNPEEDPVWDLTPFVDVPGHFGGRPRFFEWEREWRVVGRAFRFSEEDVAFLVMPEEFHEAATSFFEQARSENTGPSYTCPYIDMTWSRDRIQAVLDTIP